MNIVVVGAGYSGLAAAYCLVKRGVDVTVIEARHRVGGRTLECFVDKGMRLELGGEYIASEHTRLRALADEMQLELFPTWSEGDNFLSLAHQVARYRSTPADCLTTQLRQPPEVKREIETTLHELEAMFVEVPAEAPWKCVHLEEWDSLTFQSWLDSKLQTWQAKKFFRFMVNQGLATEPTQISMLQMLWSLKTSHGIPTWTLGHSQLYRLRGGTQLLAEKIAERLGDRLICGTPVTAIDYSDGDVHIHTQQHTYRAGAAIICMPPQLIGSLTFTPPLTADLYRTFAAFQTGTVVKVQAVYHTPFWRDRGWSGNGIAFGGPQTFTYDNSSPDGAPGVLLGFITARRATTWSRKPDDVRKNDVLKAWEEVFGPEILDPLEYLETDWTRDPYSRGGYSCHFPPGLWHELGPSLDSTHMPHCSRLFWAASDLAKDWNGYLEGAIAAGEQAADEAEASLRIPYA